MTRSAARSENRRRAFTALTPRPRASEIIATFVGVLERLDPPAARRAGRARTGEQRR